MPKCGEIKTWHWAHEAVRDCDPWYEPETEWHRSWKAHAPEERVEVTMGPHRADIVGSDGGVIELQHSSIGPDEIRDREAFYGRMVWLIDGSPFAENLRVTIDARQCRFVWAHARPSWLAAAAPKFVHGFSLGRYVRKVVPPMPRPQWVWCESGRSDAILQIRSIEAKRYVQGVGRIIEIERFVERMIG